MHEELNDVHLLSCELVSDGGTGGVAVWPRAAVNQVHRAAFGWSLVVPVVVVEAAVPAVERPGQGGTFDLHVHPVTTIQHKRALSAQKREILYLFVLTNTLGMRVRKSNTHFLVITSCDKQAGANMALKNKTT